MTTLPASEETVVWPNERVNIPDPNHKDARIVGFRIREGDEAWGELGLSEPLFWLEANIRRTREQAVRECAEIAMKVCIDDEDYGRASEVYDAILSLSQVSAKT